MPEMEIVFDPLPSEALEQLILDNLIYVNAARTGVDEWLPVNYFLRDTDGSWKGGLLGGVWGGWLHIRILWVSQTCRGQGHGSSLLMQAEAKAITYGAHSATLDTHSFQAPGFYRKFGYEIFGELDDYPEGHKKFFLRKRLA
jgi:ribosomal protein S18 acetylase RimI-like enzyme